MSVWALSTIRRRPSTPDGAQSSLGLAYQHLLYYTFYCLERLVRLLDILLFHKLVLCAFMIENDVEGMR